MFFPPFFLNKKCSQLYWGRHVRLNYLLLFLLTAGSADVSVGVGHMKVKQRPCSLKACFHTCTAALNLQPCPPPL